MTPLCLWQWRTAIHCDIIPLSVNNRHSIQAGLQLTYLLRLWQIRQRCQSNLFDIAEMISVRSILPDMGNVLFVIQLRPGAHVQLTDIRLS